MDDPGSPPTPEQPPTTRPPAAQEPPGGWDQPVEPPAEQNPYAIKRSLGKAWLFAILSFGIWTFYWFYRNRQLADGELADGRDDAMLHTFGLLVPVLNWFIVYWLWRDLNYLRQRVGLSEFSIPGYLIGSILGLGPIFYSLVLNYVNEYWDVRTGGLATEAPVRTEEKVIVGIGAAFFAFFILLFVLAIVIAIIAGS